LFLYAANMTVVNAVVEDVHPAYATNENLASIQARHLTVAFLSPDFAVQVRKMAVGLIKGDSPLLQDAGKLINKFWDLSKLEKPPYRVAFGEDAKVRCIDFFDY
jgi:hypothetical protein